MSRWAREGILDTDGVFLRMRDGADASFWLGKLLRIYVTSALWNFQRKRIFTAGNRLIYGLAVILLAHFRIFTKDFWVAFIKPYQSPAFERGLRNSGK